MKRPPVRFENAAEGRCLVHGGRLMRTVSHDAIGLPAREFLSCPLCNAEAIDRLAKQPGTITINSADIKLPDPTPQQRFERAFRESFMTGSVDPLAREIIRQVVIEPLMRELQKEIPALARGSLADQVLKNAKGQPR